MKNKLLLSIVLIAVCILSFCAVNTFAKTEGIYTYEVSNSKATITDCNTSATGAITIPKKLGGYTVTSIGDSAFWGCTGLTSVTIPDSVKSIGDYAFRGCTGLTSVTMGKGVTSIGNYAFNSCDGLTSVTIPDSVKSIGDYAFGWCDGLTSITIPDSVTSIGDSAFYNCIGLIKITIPDSVTSIGGSAFSGCTGLTSVTIPDSVTSIGDYAFRGCTGLTNVTIPDSVTSIGDSAFSGCDGLTSITIGKGVTSIGDSAFWGCTGLTSVTIPDSVKSIGDYAFRGCTGLTSVTMGKGVTSIGNEAFYNCIGLIKITIPDSVTSIGDSAFSDCTGLISVTMGKGVTSIGNSAFYYCKGLTSITIPDSVTSIGNRAFYYCDGLISVTIPDSVTSIGDSAFEYCRGLTKVNITDIAAWCNIDFGNSYANPLYYAQKLYLNGVLVTNLVIPDSVTSIGGSAFSGCTGLTSITVPDSVTSIGSSAFYWCTGLTSVTIGSGVTSIGYEAFYYCDELTEVNITDIAAWCNIKFEFCEESYSGSGSYYYDYSSNPLCYARILYLNGERVTNLVIPDSVTSIGECAFYNCKSLTGVTIGKGIEEIPVYAFYGCNNLERISLPGKITYIRADAFNGCNNIETVYYEGSESEWNEVLVYPRNENLTNANIIYNAVRKTYKFETSCKNTLSDITDVAIFTMPTVENKGKTFLGWYDNKECTGEAITFPYYGTSTTLYAKWTDKTGKSFDDAFYAEQNSRYTVTTTSRNEMVYFEFRPNLTKTYCFYSTGSYDTCGYLYDKNGNCLTYDDDSGNDNNFYISYNLKAGEKYYIAAKFYNSYGTFTLVTETPIPAEYKVNSLTVKNSSGNTVSSVPSGKFTATVSFTCLKEGEKTVIILAKYDENGAYNGLLYVGTKDVPEGSTLELTLPIDNTDGSIKTLKAFMRPVGDLLTPVGNSVSFPAK